MIQSLPAHDFDALLAAARAGDEDAFAAIWRLVQPRLLRYLRVRAGESAEDLAADTWAHVVASLDRFAGDEDGFRAWVFTIARRRCVDARRAAARRPQTGGAGDGLDEVPGRDDPTAPVEEDDATEAALRLIAELPPDQAEVVTLRVVGDLDVGQVARLVGKRPGTVRVLAHRGLRRLAELLEGQR